MFSQASVILFTRGGVGGGWCGRHTPLGRRPSSADIPLGRHPDGQTPPGRCPLDRHPPGRHNGPPPQWADTPWASPGDGCRSRRYASYWNEFLLIGIISYFSYLSFTYQSSKYVMQCLRNLFHYFLHRMAKVK